MLPVPAPPRHMSVYIGTRTPPLIDEGLHQYLCARLCGNKYWLKKKVLICEDKTTVNTAFLVL